MSEAAPHATLAWAEALEAAAQAGGSLPAAMGIDPATSADFYGELVGDVADILTEFATGSVSLVKKGELDTGNPLKPFQDETARYPRNAYVGGYPSDRIDGVRIMAADLRVIFDARNLPIAPSAADQVEIDGALRAIVRVSAVPSAGTPLLYIIQARAA